MKLPWLDRNRAIRKMNQLGAAGKEFYCILSFDQQNNLVLLPSEKEEMGIQMNFSGSKSSGGTNPLPKILNVDLPSEDTYRSAFQRVQHHLHRGDSYLLNLTFEVPITLQGNLTDVYSRAAAPYKILIPGQWVCFSPESFVRIRDRTVQTFPMKGTINASIPNAREKILGDPKETAEHYTIVDLLRNDLSMIGELTIVKKFRFLSSIQNASGGLLQVSSQIESQLPSQWRSEIGDLVFRLLPAGSISGAPKQKTVEIIQSVENHSREWYTGISGHFKDGDFDSAILIRYICLKEGNYYYKTGGGITTQSHWEDEYNEIRSKIYIPIS